MEREAFTRVKEAIKIINDSVGESLGIKIDIVDPRELQTLSAEENARFMSNQTFRRLVENIRTDGVLSSAPFCIMTDSGILRVLSGNHRVKAAIEAGIPYIFVLFTDAPLSKDKQLAIQLSHNALVGQDNLAVLAKLYKNISSVDSKRYAGLDEKTLNLVNSIELSLPKPAKVDLIEVPLIFVDEDELDEVVEFAKNVRSSHLFIASKDSFDDFIDAMSVVREGLQIINFTSAVLAVIEYAKLIINVEEDEGGR